MDSTTPSPTASERAERALETTWPNLLRDAVTAEITAAEQAARQKALEEAAEAVRFYHVTRSMAPHWNDECQCEAIAKFLENYRGCVTEPPSKETV